MRNIRVAAPAWLTSELFTNIISDMYENMLKIRKMSIKAALDNLENSITTLLRVTIKVKLKDRTTRKRSFILKVPLSDEYRLLFLYENDMYRSIVQELEDICLNHDTRVEFKAKTFYFSNGKLNNCDYILMEDLLERNFETLKRPLGLNEVETKSVLTKLAQWHATSMKRVQSVAEYKTPYCDSYFTADERQLFENMNEIFKKPFLECLRKSNLSKEIMKKVYKYMKVLPELHLNFGKVNAKQINVLNHGDIWLNNLMFQYNDANSLIDVIFIDFQMPKYGNFAQDLFWLLISSPTWDIKLNKFDHFVQFYHGSLLSHLRLLRYCSSLPTLSQLQESLREGGVWAFITVQRLLPIAVMDPYENTNIETFTNTNLEGHIARKRLLYNPRYVSQIKEIIPWLIERKYFKC